MTIENTILEKYLKLYNNLPKDGNDYGIDYRTMIQSPGSKATVEKMRQLVIDNPDLFGPVYDKAFNIKR
tara:strand:+ start:286 stop:492 length:207 start_codon:yes stop_codon:yes gene_type:complete